MLACPDAPAFLSFVAAMVHTKDARPFHPVLRALHTGLTIDQQLWLTVVFLAYDHLGSAWQAFEMQPTPGIPPAHLWRLPMYNDRRVLRGGKIARHFLALLRLIRPYGSLHAWVTDGWGADPIANYLIFWDRAQTVWGNGRWAAFKWTEYLKHVHGLPLSAPDMRLAGASGPLTGLALLYKQPAARLAKAWHPYEADLMGRVQTSGIACDWETLEKLLCNWHSLAHGRYYVGYDIDAMHDEITAAPARLQPALWAARAQTLPHASLGELGGWGGIDPQRLKLYKTHRTLALRGGGIWPTS